jgi:S1-C subfamily serine protease
MSPPSGVRPIRARCAVAAILILMSATACGTSTNSNAPTGSAATSVGAELQSEFVSVVRKVGPSVVLIQNSVGLGSGIVFDTKGDIVTNAHVVGTDKQFLVTTGDGRTMAATLVGSFPTDDLAVIRAAKTDLQPATFADSSKLVVGDVVLAIGNPLGLQSSVTEGIVSATGRTVAEPGGAALPNVLQTSAAINPGNSGGALVDINGAVVGIPTLTATDPELGGVAPGIGFAIPSNTATDIATQFVRDGKVVSSHRADLGARTANVQGAPGVLVYSVVPGGPADKAGIKPGDVIVSLDGKPTPDSTVVAIVLAQLSPGQTVKVKVLHPDKTAAEVDVTLGELRGG